MLAAMAIITIQPCWSSAGVGCFQVTLAELDDVARLREAIHVRDPSLVPEQQRLTTFAGRPLEDGHTLAHYNICKAAVCWLDSVFELSIRWWHDFGLVGRYYLQEARASDTVASLKDKISGEFRIPCYKFFLTLFDGDVRLEDNRTLHSYELQNRDCITVSEVGDIETESSD